MGTRSLVVLISSKHCKVELRPRTEKCNRRHRVDMGGGRRQGWAAC